MLREGLEQCAIVQLLWSRGDPVSHVHEAGLKGSEEPCSGCGCRSENGGSKPYSILVGAAGSGKSDSVSLLSGEWNSVVTPRGLTNRRET